jgi:ATP phosphoribosyltransferase regulatory subunit
MPGKTSEQRRALERLNRAIVPVFEAAGAEFIDPDIIQPADVFLERSGENIRARTYVFNDPAGQELCLRPDLTVPTCRFHLEHASDPEQPARYCYAGKAFRHSTDAGGGVPVREFDQAGMELFGAGDAVRDDAEVLAVTLAALKAAGVKGARVELGDLGLFSALLQSIDMPQRWRARLRRQFWRPRAFRDLLNSLARTGRRQTSSLTALLDELEAAKVDTVSFVEQRLEAEGLQMLAGRTVEQVAARLDEKLSDRSQPPLSTEQVRLINAYLGVRCAPQDALVRLKELAAETNGAFADAVALFEARLDALQQAGLDPSGMEFAAVFGRSLEYYTGFVFQIELEQADGSREAIAGGGRYDTMLADIGAGRAIPAVGTAIQASRLLSARGTADG